MSKSAIQDVSFDDGETFQPVLVIRFDNFSFLPGMSGSPILDRATGKIIAIETGIQFPLARGKILVDPSRGFGIPVADVCEKWPAFEQLHSRKPLVTGLKVVGISICLSLTSIILWILISRSIQNNIQGMPPTIKILEFNGVDIRTLREPIHACYYKNLIMGETSNTESNIYILTRSLIERDYIVQPSPALTPTNFMGGTSPTRDFTGYCVVGREDKPTEDIYIVYIILTDKVLQPGTRLRELPYKKPITSIKIKQIYPGSFIRQESSIQMQSPMAPQPSTTPLPPLPQPQLSPLPPHQPPLATKDLYVDIFLGEKDVKRDKIESRIITANLYQQGFEGPQIRAEIDWGEGSGWEVINPQVDVRGEKYYVLHTYEVNIR